MRRIALFLIILNMVFVLPSCSLMANNSGNGQAAGSGDIIIPPGSEPDNGINMNQRNLSNSSNVYQQNVVNRLYDKISSDKKIIGFDVDEKRIYALSEDKVLVYGIENSSLLSEINSEDIAGCTSVALANGTIYLYSGTTGNILKFDTGGNPAGTLELKLQGLDIEKMQVDGTGRIYLLVTARQGGSDYIQVIEPENGNSYRIGEDDLEGKLAYSGTPADNADAGIRDFCLKDDRSIIIRVFPERMCLYNTAGRKVERVSYLPDSARFLDFDSNILYYASGLKVAVFNNQFANISNEGSGDIVGRLTIGDTFPWSADPVSLADFQLGDIINPYSSGTLRHKSMRQNNKYIFFLDYETGKAGNSDNGSCIYRLAK